MSVHKCPCCTCPRQVLPTTLERYRNRTPFRTAVFWSKVSKGRGECWEWMAARDPDGYGVFNYLGTSVAHRVSWFLNGGVLEGGMVLHHVCRNRGCVRPSHLMPCTNIENLSFRDSDRRARALRCKAEGM